MGASLALFCEAIDYALTRHLRAQSATIRPLPTRKPIIAMSKKNRPEPQHLGQPIIETHCHLDYLKENSLDEIVAQATAVGVEQIITIAVDPDNLVTVRNIAQAHNAVFCTQGIHPHDADRFNAEVAEVIKEGLQLEKTVAVGEIGLDYYYDNSPREQQRATFAAQLEIAANADLPIVVHTREADEDTAAILAEFAPQLARKGVIHSFTSSLELSQTCLELGFCLGFNGIITFNRADNVREVLAHTPLDRLLLETDAPFLTPVPHRGKENAPRYLPFIAEKAAQTKGVPLPDLLERAYRNSKALFFPDID